MEILFILISLALLMYLAYRGFSVVLLAPVYLHQKSRMGRLRL